MLFTLTFWQLAIVFGAGLLIGFILLALFKHKFTSTEEKVDQSNAEQQLKRYRFAVHQHLSQTSELIHQLGEDYDRLNEQLRHDMHELDSPDAAHVVSHLKKHGHHVEPKLDTMPKTYFDPDNKHHN
jgi:uncharacterized membrane-anchored protein YhcB (DUF1043 family)